MGDYSSNYSELMTLKHQILTVLTKGDEEDIFELIVDNINRLPIKTLSNNSKINDVLSNFMKNCQKNDFFIHENELEVISSFIYLTSSRFGCEQ